MFHVKRRLRALSGALASTVSDEQWDSLEAYTQWLSDEAVVAGGLGPAESDRLVDRHIGDSLAFALAFPAQPHHLTDVGSGVGLPGIPLAVLWPGTEVVLLDRSQRRVELCERAVRVLRLTNVSVLQRDLSEETRPFEAVVTRAVLPPEDWVRQIGPRLAAGGRAVTTLGSLDPMLDAAPGYDLEIMTVPETLLDHPVRLLMMTRKLQG